MEMIRLGRTGLNVSKNGFGALPVQRVGMEEACRILRRAFEGGINYFDTAHYPTCATGSLSPPRPWPPPSRASGRICTPAFR